VLEVLRRLFEGTLATDPGRGLNSYCLDILRYVCCQPVRHHSSFTSPIPSRLLDAIHC
jgi:hypothetical protein